MQLRVTIIMASVALAACAAPPPGSGREGPPVELAGRSAGKPQHCIGLSQLESLRVSETNRSALVYGSGRTIYANDVGPSCGFRRDDVLVTEPMGSQLCRGDLVRSIDRYSRIPGPTCVLGDFVPYVR